jgi:hypothetical protein
VIRAEVIVGVEEMEKRKYKIAQRQWKVVVSEGG